MALPFPDRSDEANQQSQAQNDAINAYIQQINAHNTALAQGGGTLASEAGLQYVPGQGWVRGNPTPSEQAYANATGSGNDQLQFGQAMQATRLGEMGYTPQYDANGHVVGFAPTPGGLEAQKNNVLANQFGYAGNQLKSANNQLNVTGQNQAADVSFLQRAQQALSGNGPADPTVAREFDRQEQALRNQMFKQLGPGWETSSAGIEALGNFNRNKAEAIYQSNADVMTRANDAAVKGQSVAPNQAQMNYSALQTGQAVGNPWDTQQGVSNASTMIAPYAAQGTPDKVMAEQANAVQFPFTNQNAFQTLTDLFNPPLNRESGQRISQNTTNNAQFLNSPTQTFLNNLAGKVAGGTAGAVNSLFQKPNGGNTTTNNNYNDYSSPGDQSGSVTMPAYEDVPPSVG